MGTWIGQVGHGSWEQLVFSKDGSFDYERQVRSGGFTYSGHYHFDHTGLLIFEVQYRRPIDGVSHRMAATSRAFVLIDGNDLLMIDKTNGLENKKSQVFEPIGSGHFVRLAEVRRRKDEFVKEWLE